ncbi:MAG: type II toxin-antitoxin system VapC family toxin [Nanoarchaeota archaeon]
MVFLDTDVIINFLRKEPNAVNLIEKLKEDEEPLKTTTINEFELWKGAYRKKTEEAHNSVKKLLSELEISSLTSTASRKAAEIFEDLQSQGETTDVLDVMIASIAITNKEMLATQNKRHFGRIPELKIMPEI